MAGVGGTKFDGRGLLTRPAAKTVHGCSSKGGFQMLSKLTHTGRARVIMRLAAIAFPFLPLTYDHTNGAKTKTANPRPNVIIILADNQGYGDLRCHGNDVIQARHRDGLYEQCGTGAGPLGATISLTCALDAALVCDYNVV